MISKLPHTVQDNFSKLFTPPRANTISYYGVFDGHAGAKAATYCADELHTHIMKKWPAQGRMIVYLVKVLYRFAIKIPY